LNNYLLTHQVSMFIPIKIVNNKWQSDLVHLRSIFRQLRNEAGLSDNKPDPEDAYDKILQIAGKYNLGLETNVSENN
jgi:hypothetical protein